MREHAARLVSAMLDQRYDDVRRISSRMQREGPPEHRRACITKALEQHPDPRAQALLAEVTAKETQPEPRRYTEDEYLSRYWMQRFLQGHSFQ
jgi:hypothetical protein